MPTLYQTLRADIVTAVKARDAARTLALRTADAAIQRAALDLAKPIDDGLVTATLRKAVKNLADAREEFARGGRQDLVTANTTEIAVLEVYLPKSMDPQQLETAVAAAIQETGATTKKDMGKVMGRLKQRPDVALIDFAAVSKLLQSKLT